MTTQENFIADVEELFILKMAAVPASWGQDGKEAVFAKLVNFTVDQLLAPGFLSA